jgi:hypothetical protein
MPTPSGDRSGRRDGQVTGVTSVREHPSWYFRTGQFDTAEMLGLLVSEATAAGALDVSVRHVGWWIVASSTDWLDGEVTCFFELTSDHASGRNSARVEILLTAFCPQVWTGARGVAYDVTVNGDPPDAVLHALTDQRCGRVIAFVPPEITPVPEPSATPDRRLRLVSQELDKAIEKVARLSGGAT